MPLLWCGCCSMSKDRVVRTQSVFIHILSLSLFFYNFETMFIKTGNSETRKGLGQKKKQERI